MTLEYQTRGYAGAAPSTTLSSGITNSASSLTIASGTGYPTSNFALVIDPGTASEEKVFVGSRSSGTCSSVTRGIDGTSGTSHLSGAVVQHVIIAQDISEANAVASAMTTKGDLLTRNSTATAAPQRLAVGTDEQRLVAASGQTLGMKWVADTTNYVITAAGDMLIGTAADTVAKVATSGVTGWTSFTPALTQSGAVTKTVNYAKYCQIGKLVTYVGKLTATGAGSSANKVTVELPVTAASSADMVVGSGFIYDSSVAIAYNGLVRIDSTSTIAFFSGSSANASITPWGATNAPSTAALASNDIASWSITYEAA